MPISSSLQIEILEEGKRNQLRGPRLGSRLRTTLPAAVRFFLGRPLPRSFALRGKEVSVYYDI